MLIFLGDGWSSEFALGDNCELTIIRKEERFAQNVDGLVAGTRHRIYNCAKQPVHLDF